MQLYTHKALKNLDLTDDSYQNINYQKLVQEKSSKALAIEDVGKMTKYLSPQISPRSDGFTLKFT